MRAIVVLGDPLGSAGAVRAAGDWLGDEAGLVIAGPIDAAIDIGALVERHRRSGGVVTLAVSSMPGARGRAAVIVGDDGRVHGYQHDPDPAEALSDLRDLGVYCFSPEVFEYFPDQPAADWARDVFPALLDHDVPFHAHEVHAGT
jgi:NDP-sugar pyrophosphorylase family protein